MVGKTVVYYGYLGEEGTEEDVLRKRLGFMETQLKWLAELIAPLSEQVDVLVAYLAPKAWDDAVRAAASRRGFRIDPACAADEERRNRFEYPGFRAMKALAQASAPDDLIYYCHSKGIVQLSPTKMGLFRLHTEVGLTADLGTMIADPTITRAGIFPSKRGWCWHNFFWVKAGHMAGLAVEESTDRYHFEALIGDYDDIEGYKGVLPLIDRLPFDATGIEPRPWYRPAETGSPTLTATCGRYAAMPSPASSPGLE
jgi:hypothetical protein